jgi:SAM-dependent methyltransferase
MSSDLWLQRWLPLVRERAGILPVLELGCGGGEDTATLIGAGHRVIGIDLSARSIAEAQAKVPAAEYHCQDIRAQFPTHATELGVVVASLSLHYFAWSETVALVGRVHNALRSGGVLLCRLNSTNDHNYGASGHPRIADDYYSVHGESKRFFNRESVHELFAKGWRILAAEEMVIYKYADPKAVWEVVLERAPCVKLL